MPHKVDIQGDTIRFGKVAVARITMDDGTTARANFEAAILGDVRDYALSILEKAKKKAQANAITIDELQEILAGL